MKFAFIVNNYPPRIGGVELHVQALATELVQQGHQALVVTLADRVTTSLDNGIMVNTLKEHFRTADILGFPGLGTSRKLAKLLKAESIDVVSIHTRFFPMSYVGLRAGLLAKIPVIHTEHGSDHVSSESPIIRWVSRIVDYTFGRAVLRRATRVLGVSEEVVKFVKSLAHVEATLFYNAIQLPSSPLSLRMKHPGHFVFVGRLVQGKGWETFIDGLHALQQRENSFRATIVGSGPDLSRVEDQIREFDLGNQVTVLGQIPQVDVREILRGSTLVNPTTLSEGFQTTLLETVGEGGRVLTYPVPGAKTLQSDGAPVQITSSRSPEQLVQLMADSLNEDWRPASFTLIEKWCWPIRAFEYATIAQRIAAKTSVL